MFLEECKAHFETDCLYELLGVAKDCNAEALRKGYYRQAKLWHPDKAELDDEARQTYTVKFQLLNKVYKILSDTEKRNIYDETGSVDDKAGEFNNDFLKTWRRFFEETFKAVTKEEIDNDREMYCGSEEQKEHIIIMYNMYKGDFGRIRTAGIIGCEDDDNLKATLDTLIAEGSIEKTKKYDTTTSEKKMKAYKRKAEKEATDAENLVQVQTRRKRRGAVSLDDLEAMYSAPSSSKKAKRQ